MNQIVMRGYDAKKKDIISGKITAYIYQLGNQPPEGYEYRGTVNGQELFEADGCYFFASFIYYPGDELYVREAYAVVEGDDGQMKVVYRADPGADPSINWVHCTLMPPEAADVFLEVTRTEITRLSDISKEAARAAGATGRNPQQQARKQFKEDHAGHRALAQIVENPWVQVVYFQTIPKPASASTAPPEKIKRRQADLRTYTFRDSATGEIVGHGTMKECAEAMNLGTRTLYTYMSAIKAGRNTRYTVELTNPGEYRKKDLLPHEDTEESTKGDDHVQ